MSDSLRHHICDQEDSWPEYDARGIYLTRVCDLCVDAKLAQFRPEVLTDSNYWHDEPLDEE